MEGAILVLGAFLFFPKFIQLSLQNSSSSSSTKFFCQLRFLSSQNLFNRLSKDSVSSSSTKVFLLQYLVFPFQDYLIIQYECCFLQSGKFIMEYLSFFIVNPKVIVFSFRYMIPFSFFSEMIFLICHLSVIGVFFGDCVFLCQGRLLLGGHLFFVQSLF